ncbi:hypothetical protein [Lentzea sp. NBRC 102530]|uniref:DUF6414 family protein n=1 Tax=Lentzea sp. NBRC 102530 TaxID=3032201 RepID=UPI0024A5437C|nr:hypothetical protein [Lentzea sp. NBRC 102530]GLY51877.1 hypothetical protein Lesp01_55330 [Lentzea sp. NBRC 102530]
MFKRKKKPIESVCRVADLVHPTYLNTPMLINFLASIDDGVSFSSDVAQKYDRIRKTTGEGTASGAVPSVASLLGLNLSASGKLSHERNNQETTESKFVRQHTAASLFNRLRTTLDKAKLIKVVTSIEDLQKVQPGALIECAGVIEKNPMDVVADLYEDARPYFLQQKRMEIRKDDESLSEDEVREEADREIIDMDEIFKVVAEDVRKSKVVDLPMTIAGVQIRAVLAASREYFTDEVEASLLGGEFKVLGKVTRAEVVEGKKLTTVRRGVIGLIGEERLELLMNSMANTDIELKIPEVAVKSPWVQIVPLAIYI